MRFVYKVGVFALALMLSAVPTMACLLPNVTMTAAEQECCKRMANECDSAGMPSNHPCCQRVVGPENNFVKAPNAQLDHIAGSSYVSNVSAPLLLSGIPLVHASLDFGVHGPPDSPPTTISILRI